ncbi:MAG: hypothetical protein Ct9H300mP12_17720 [Acidimicrobiales bacterium]|nr:MAG: hypothetical protein Ct9H300mP12_17720 [Acidimicrobiales bacterium]
MGEPIRRLPDGFGSLAGWRSDYLARPAQLGAPWPHAWPTLDMTWWGGPRSKYRAMEVCDKIFDRWPKRSLSIRATDNAGAADAEVVVIATPWDAAAATARSVADHLHRKVVICMSNAIAQVAGEFQPLVPPRGSVSASVQAEVTDAYVAAALHHVPAPELGNLDHELASDVLVCSDHRRATETVSEIISGFPGRPTAGCRRPVERHGL